MLTCCIDVLNVVDEGRLLLYQGLRPDVYPLFVLSFWLGYLFRPLHCRREFRVVVVMKVCVCVDVDVRVPTECRATALSRCMLGVLNNNTACCVRSLSVL